MAEHHCFILLNSSAGVSLNFDAANHPLTPKVICANFVTNSNLTRHVKVFKVTWWMVEESHDKRDKKDVSLLTHQGLSSDDHQVMY